jgi:Domain of unknown function (DUF4203)
MFIQTPNDNSAKHASFFVASFISGICSGLFAQFYIRPWIRTMLAPYLSGLFGGFCFAIWILCLKSEGPSLSTVQKMMFICSIMISAADVPRYVTLKDAARTLIPEITVQSKDSSSAQMGYQRYDTERDMAESLVEHEQGSVIELNMNMSANAGSSGGKAPMPWKQNTLLGQRKMGSSSKPTSSFGRTAETAKDDDDVSLLERQKDLRAQKRIESTVQRVGSSSSSTQPSLNFGSSSSHSAIYKTPRSLGQSRLTPDAGGVTSHQPVRNPSYDPNHPARIKASWRPEGNGPVDSQRVSEAPVDAHRNRMIKQTSQQRQQHQDSEMRQRQLEEQRSARMSSSPALQEHHNKQLAALQSTAETGTDDQSNKSK